MSKRRNTSIVAGASMAANDRSDDANRALLVANKLVYRLPPSLSVVTSRTHKSYDALARTYSPKQIMTFVLSSGASYINTQNSYLTFTIRKDPLEPGPDLKIESGTMCNIFRSMRIMHSSGAELDRMDDVYNLYLNRIQTMTKSYEWGLSQRVMMGGSAELKAGEELDVVIPLKELTPNGGFFDQQMLMPSYMASGLRLEFTLEGADIAFRAAGRTDGQTPAYIVHDPRIVLDTVVLSDAITRKLSQISSNDSLEWVWNGVHTNSVTTTTSESTIEVTKALSRANSIWAVARYERNLKFGATADINDSYGVDSFEWNPIDPAFPAVPLGTSPFVRWQYILGSLHFPLIPVESDLESFMHMLTWNKSSANERRTSGMTVPLFESTRFAAIQVLERSSTLSQSGTAVGSQRGLLFKVTHRTDVDSDPRVTTLFTHHTKVCGVFLDNVVLRS